MKEPFAGALIVNADDLGASATVNDSIFRLLQAGILTSSTVLANGPCVEPALAGLRAFPGRSFGVHLNAVEFKPLRPTAGLEPLLAPDGSFQDVIRRVHMTRELLRAITDEWAAQIEKVRATVPISHLDSHRHVHTLPALVPVLRELSETYGIRKLRISLNLFGKAERKSRTLLLKKAAYNRFLRYRGFRTADVCGSFADFLSWMPEWPRGAATVEVMTHPGHPKYAAETALLESDWRASLPPGVRLISYHELARTDAA